MFEWIYDQIKEIRSAKIEMASQIAFDAGLKYGKQEDEKIVHVKYRDWEGDITYKKAQTMINRMMESGLEDEAQLVEIKETDNAEEEN